MSGRRRERDERLHRPPLRIPLPRGGPLDRLRWLAAIVLVGLAGLLLHDPPAAARLPTVPVLVAAHDLPAGVPLSRDDVRTARLPRSLAPAGVLVPGDRVAGRRAATPVRRGEPLTDVRLLGPALVQAAAGDPTAVAAPVLLADPGVGALVRAGDRVDVIATPADGHARAAVVAAGVPVLSTPRPTDGGTLLVVATDPRTATRLAQAAVRARLSVTLRG